MSVHISSPVWRLRLPATEKLILLKLADCADDDGTNAFPSVGRVAEECGIHPRTVQKILRHLKATGLISIQAEHDGSRHFPTTYQIHPARGDTLPPRTYMRGGVRPPAPVPLDAYPGGVRPPYPSLDPSSTITARASENAKPSRIATARAESPERLKEEKAQNPLMVSCRTYAFLRWQERFGNPPIWAAKDFVGLARLLKRNRSITEPEFKIRWDLYLEDRDPFTQRQGYSLGFFCSRFDVFMPEDRFNPPVTELKAPY